MADPNETADTTTATHTTHPYDPSGVPPDNAAPATSGPTQPPYYPSGRPYDPATATVEDDRDKAPTEPVADLSMDALRGAVAAVRLIFMFQNRRRRGELLHAAEGLGLLQEGDAAQYLENISSGVPARDQATRSADADLAARVNDLHAVLATVPPLRD